MRAPLILAVVAGLLFWSATEAVITGTYTNRWIDYTLAEQPGWFMLSVAMYYGFGLLCLGIAAFKTFR